MGTTVQCTGCGKTTTDDQLRDGLCGLCVYDRDRAKYSEENKELEAKSRSRRRKAELATLASVLIAILGIGGYFFAKWLVYHNAHERMSPHYKEY